MCLRDCSLNLKRQLRTRGKPVKRRALKNSDQLCGGGIVNAATEPHWLGVVSLVERRDGARCWNGGGGNRLRWCRGSEEQRDGADARSTKLLHSYRHRPSPSSAHRSRI